MKNVNIIEHRNDIDGLRAVAVFSVIFFHIWPKNFTGGFVGVDIFFVLSGYLISQIIIKDIVNGNFNILNFYTRRMKRILPMMYMVIFGTIIVAYFIMLPSPFMILSKISIWTSTYISNMYFVFYSLDYFNNSTQSYPLLHTWTLAVEEQFYVFWPILLFILLSKKFFGFQLRKLLLCTVILLLCFFSLSIAINLYNKNIGYYFLFSRAFEFVIGGLVAILILVFYNRKNNIHLGNILSVTSAILILGTVFLVKESSANNALLVLPSTLGTAFFIIAGHYNSEAVFNKFLSHKLFVYIGLISYSLYLWHWPIIAFWNYLHSNDSISFTSGIIILLISLFLSVLSYYLVENNTRYTKFGFFTTLLFYQIIPMVFVCGVALYIQKNNGFLHRIHSDSERARVEFLDDRAKFCFDGENSKYNKNFCIFGGGDSSVTNVLLIGDSHAANYFGFWNTIAQKYGFKFKFLAVGTCNPIMNIDNKHKPQTQNTGTRCATQVEYFTKHYDDYRLIVIAGAWGSYLESNNLSKNLIYKNQQEETFRKLNDDRRYTLVMSDIPYLKEKVDNQYLIVNQYFKLKQLESNYALDKNMAQNRSLYSMIESYNYIKYFDIYDSVIININSYPWSDDFFVYNDGSHLNQFGSSKIASKYLEDNRNNFILDILESSGVISHK